ncbi:hypothetical protein CRE_21394 [Caenorhabditis remanei]|uniref:Homeobox domain-containing protein n=1 Tax=Caenorhabditis remanei TaxID=31234 RepID=E3MUQ1_CAERE|nr:hypothetical protein CRE_21394 [Caenorhabditis remanei]
MIHQMSVPVEILDVKINISLKCNKCGTVIRLTKEKEVARCNKCQSKSKERSEACKMKVNVIHSQNYFEVDLSFQAITQFFKNVVKFQGKARSDWININLESYWPNWRNKKVGMILCLSDEKWSCIGIKELEENFKPVPNPQSQETNGRASRRDEDIRFEAREVKEEEVAEPVDGPLQNVQEEKRAEGREKRHEHGGGLRLDGINELEEDLKPVANPQIPDINGSASSRGEDIVFENREVKEEEVEEADDGPRQMEANVDVQGEEQAKESERRHENGGGIRVDKAVSVRFHQNSKMLNSRRRWSIEEFLKILMILRGYDEMDMDYDVFEEERDRRHRENFDDGDLSCGDNMDMDFDIGRDNRDEEEQSNESREELKESDNEEEERRSSDDSDSEQESRANDEKGREDDRDEVPEQKRTKRRSVKAVTSKKKKKNYTELLREYFSVEQKKRLNDEFERTEYLSQEQLERIAKKTKLTVKQVTKWFKNQRYRKQFI